MIDRRFKYSRVINISLYDFNQTNIYFNKLKK